MESNIVLKKPATEIDIARIDTAITAIVRLKGMFGAISYLTNPDGARTGYPTEDFESWFADIGEKLDEVVKLLCET